MGIGRLVSDRPRLELVDPHHFSGADLMRGDGRKATGPHTATGLAIDSEC